MRFKEFKLSVEENALKYLKMGKESKELEVVHQNSINDAHIQLGAKERCSKTDEIYHSVVLNFFNGKSRAIYFKAQEQQCALYDMLLTFQGFDNPLDQYILKRLPLQKNRHGAVTQGMH